jgi:hypothetical protein
MQCCLWLRTNHFVLISNHLLAACVCVWFGTYLPNWLAVNEVFLFLFLLDLTFFSVCPYSVHMYTACLCLSCSSGWLLRCSCRDDVIGWPWRLPSFHFCLLSSLLFGMLCCCFKWIRQEKRSPACYCLASSLFPASVSRGSHQRVYLTGK